MKNRVRLILTNVTKVVPRLETVEININYDPIIEGFSNKVSDSLMDLELQDRIPIKIRGVSRKNAHIRVQATNIKDFRFSSSP